MVLSAWLVLLLVAAKYHNDLSGAGAGPLPKDFQSVGGTFMVVEVDGNKMIELAGEPLDAFGLLYGPAEHAALDARAKIWGATSGRRFPEFGVGVGDVGGYRLLLLPGQKRLELRRGDNVLQSAEMTQPWQSQTWTWVRLRLSKEAEGRWAVEGKAWPADAAEPGAWQVAHETSDAPSAGRASVWGIPFSGQPIRFDDLAVEPTGTDK